MRPFWPFLKIMMYTLHRMYQRLLHPTKLYQAAHTVPLVYSYVPVHFLPVIYIPSTSRLSTDKICTGTECEEIKSSTSDKEGNQVDRKNTTSGTG